MEVRDPLTGTAAELSYEAFGLTRASGLEQPYGFTGREFDRETGLYHYRARVYDPRTGTFLQSDPIRFAAGDLNTYAYTFGDPVNWRDPSGLVATGEWTATTGGSRAVGAIGRGISGALNGIMSQLARVFPTVDRIAQAAECAGAVASAVAGDFVSASQGGVECIMGGRGRGARSARRGGGTCSFDGATLVRTEDGLRPIEELEAGDLVWSRDADTGAMDWRAVLAQYANEYEETVYVSIRDVETGAEQTLTSNRIHPFFVQTERSVEANSEGHVYRGALPNGHWIDAGDLLAGDRLLNPDGSWAEVLSVEIETRPLQAFNLTVDEFGTYFVSGNAGADPVWVHNTCGRPSDSSHYSVGYEGRLNPASYPGVTRWRHYQEMNEQLHQQFQNDPAFARQMEDTFLGMSDFVGPGARGGRTIHRRRREPVGTTL